MYVGATINNKIIFKKVLKIFTMLIIITFSGLTPGESMKKIGVDGLVSSKDFANSTVLPSTYLLPNFSSIKALKENVSY